MQTLKKLLRILTSAALLALIWFSPELKHHYYQIYKASHVVQVKENGGTGTAYYLKYKDDTFVITNKHVCDMSMDKKTLVAGGVLLRILHVSQSTDICVLESDREEGLTLADSWKIGEPVTCIGYPMNFSQHVVQGHIADKGVDMFDWVGRITYIETSCLSAPGTSGSPILDAFGNVIGTLFAGSPMFPGGNLAVPLEDMIRVIEFAYKKEHERITK